MVGANFEIYLSEVGKNTEIIQNFEIYFSEMAKNRQIVHQWKLTAHT